MGATSCWNGEENEKEGVADIGYELNTSLIPILLQGSAGRKETEELRMKLSLETE